jgi:hypothetical protein
MEAEGDGKADGVPVGRIVAVGTAVGDGKGDADGKGVGLGTSDAPNSSSWVSKIDVRGKIF